MENARIDITRTPPRSRGRSRPVEDEEGLSSIGALASGVSHEVNNPLAVIMGFAELLARTSDNGDVKKFAGLIRQEGEKIRRITERLLEIGRQGRPERAPHDLNEVVDDVLAATDHRFPPFSALEIDSQQSPGRLAARFDRGQIRQVLLNLLRNAAEATPDGGRIVVRTFERTLPEGGPVVGFSVTDHGPGVPDPIRREIFKPLFTTKKGRAGLGLRVCQDILAGHGGGIDLEKAQGPGTTFRVWIPLSSLEAPDA